MQNLKKATFGGGCFWCIEAVFLKLKGVHSSVSGFSGGKEVNPTYEEICMGKSTHAEVIQVEFDPSEISYRKLIEVFFRVHDPTTLNRQGEDVGVQYRSIVLTHDEEQEQQVKNYIAELKDNKAFKDPIVTEIKKYQEFYPAQKQHQDFFNCNPWQPYSAFVIKPKVERAKKEFGDILKEPHL